ncbi:MAG: hypothetical protein CMJ25_05060 [Phycisphaerae bacterium]|nr:hypothetical protein [Phycisphaerae bacterium]
MQQLQPLFVWILIVMAITAPALAQQPEHAPKRPTLLLVEHEQHPRVTITWTADGQPQRHTMVMPFTAPVGGEQLGDSNALAYATMGGTRIETGAGHPKGAVIRVGLTKAERTKAFFKSIDPGTSIEISITGVRFNQPVKYHEGTGLVHLKYAIADLEACALPGEARNQYLMTSPDDTLGGRVKRGINASPGALDAKPGHGQVEIIVQPDDPTLVDMHVQLPYALLRHLQDPWVSDLPGTFFEPIHFHAEAELIPVDVAPLVREEIIPEINESQRPNAEPARD